MKDTQKLTQKKIIELQKELHHFNVVEEITDYRINKDYLELFLERYSKLEGEYGFIQGAVLTSLFDFIRRKEPNIVESDLITKSQRLYPIIRGMLVQERVFKLINDAKKGKLKWVEK